MDLKSGWRTNYSRRKKSFWPNQPYWCYFSCHGFIESSLKIGYLQNFLL